MVVKVVNWRGGGGGSDERCDFEGDATYTYP